MPVASTDSPPAPPSASELRFGRLLVLIIAVYVAVIAFGASPLSRLIRVALLVLVLLAVVRIRRTGRGWASLTAANALVALAAAAVAYGVGSVRLSVVLVSAAVLLLSVASIAVIATRLWLRPHRDAQTVAGALVVYLLLALQFAALNQLFAALLGLPYLNGVSDVVDSASYLYFSVVTLSTVGYGDVTPACDTARAMAMSEALIGQLYLVAVVGTVVGNLGGRRRSAATPEPSATSPEPSATTQR